MSSNTNSDVSSEAPTPSPEYLKAVEELISAVDGLRHTATGWSRMSIDGTWQANELDRVHVGPKSYLNVMSALAQVRRLE